MMANSALKKLFQSAQTVSSDWKWVDDQAVILGSDSDFHIFYNEATGKLLITDGENTLFTLEDLGTIGKLLLGSIETSAFSGNLNSQSKDPPLSISRLGEFFYKGEGGDNWESSMGTFASLTNPIISYPVGSDLDLALMKLCKFKLFADNMEVTIVRIDTTWQFKWYYSIDGGTTWILVGTSQVLIASGTIVFDINEVVINGADITDDVKLLISVTSPETDGGETQDITAIVSYHQVALKTP